MPPEVRLLALLFLVVPFVLVGIFVVALVRRYRGQRVPAGIVWAGALLLGLSLSPAFIFFIREPFWVIAMSAVALWIGWLLLRSGRFRTAGLVLLGLCLPGALWWGRFLVLDALDPDVSYDPVLLLWWLPELVGLVMGTGLVIIGDKSAPAAERLVSRPPHAVRDPMALSNALYRKLRFGPFVLPGLVAEAAAFVFVAVVVPGTLGIGVPWPVAFAVGAGGFALIATELWYVAIPSDIRAAWEGFALVGHPEQERWRAATGTPVPNTQKKMLAWLRDHDERPELRWAHAELLAVVGRLGEARAMAERIEPESPAQAFDRASLLAYIDWIGGGEPDLSALLQHADEIGEPGSRERLLARGQVAVAVARERVVTNGDWMAPLAALRDEAGALARKWFRQDTHRQRMLVSLGLGLLLSGLFVLPGLVMPVLR